MQRIGIVLLAIALPALAQTDDIAGARAVFDANVNAIRQKNLDAYLSCYLHSPLLVRGGPTGFTTGYDEFAKARGPWPDSIEASDVHLTQLQPGWVYGTYRYRVRYGSQEVAGLSERLFVKTAAGWKITATTAFQPATPATTAGASPRAPAAASPGHLLTRSAQLTRYGRMGASSSVERLAGVSLIQDLSPQTVAA